MTRTGLVALAACAILLTMLAGHAHASSFTPGDVVVYRVGTGSGALSSSAFPVFLDEYAPNGTLVESLEMPTTASGSNKPLVGSGSASSEGLLTLSGNDEYLMLPGYDTAVGTAKLSETTDTAVPRTIGRVSGSQEINTSTALTDVGNANNPRGVTSSDGTNIWWSGAGKSTTGGVHYTTLGASTSTLMSTADTNARAVAIFDGQLYTDSDPTKEGINVATVGSGLPTSGGQATTNLSFGSAPAEPYAFTLLTLGLGMAPDTMYVADNSAGAVLKFGLAGGKWEREGSVAVTSVTGVTADDTNGVVTIFATSAGSSGEGGTLYKITDSSGVGGTLSGSADLIATAPANEAFRGVAFTPGTTFGSGGTPPPPAPEISLSESNLPAAIEDPTNPTLGVTVSSTEYAAGELTVTAGSSNESVAPTSGLSVGGGGGQRTLTVTPGGTVGHATITLTVEAPNGATASTTVNYALSAYQGDPSDRYYSGAGNASTAIDVGGGYMILGDDEGNVLRLYRERVSGPPVKTFDFTSKLPFGATEMDIESSARAGNVLYWMGSLSNSKKGKLEPGRDVVFAAEITGSGASTELTYLGSYTHLREDMVAWDEANGNPLGLEASTESGVPSNETRGFNAEGLEFAPGSTSIAYIAFRAPLESPNDRKDSLLVPVTNFSSLIGGGTSATFGAPIEWNLGGLGIREIRRNAAGEYLLIAGTSDDSNSTFGLYTWDGNPAEEPVLTETAIAGVNEGAWEDIVSVPEPIASGDEVELIEDNGDSVWYADGLDSKDGLPAGLMKDLGRLFTIELPAPPAPSTPGKPQLSAGVTPNDNGQFTLSWEASSGKGVTYVLQQQNGEGGWSTVATGLASAEYTFGAGNPESQGTWTYRVIADDEGGESEPSGVSAPVTVFTKIISTSVPTKLVVKSGEAVELTSTAGILGTVTVQTGGALDIEGAKLASALHAEGASALRICGAHIYGLVKIIGSHGHVAIGDGSSDCAPDTFAKAVTVKGNAAGVQIEGQSPSSENVFEASLVVGENEGRTSIVDNDVHTALTVTGDHGATTVVGNQTQTSMKVSSNHAGVVVTGNTIQTTLGVAANQGGTTVTENHVGGALTVKENAAPVLDTPNTVSGKSKLQ